MHAWSIQHCVYFVTPLSTESGVDVTLLRMCERTNKWTDAEELTKLLGIAGVTFPEEHGLEEVPDV